MESLFIFMIILGFDTLGAAEWRVLPCVSSEPSIDCFAHYNKGEQDCFPAALAAKFPHLYDLEGEAPPERPSPIVLTPFERQYSENPTADWMKNVFSGVNVSIQPPITASVNYVRGFELRYSKMDVNGGGSTGEPRCIVFNFSSPLIASLRYTKFSIEVYPIAIGLWPFTVYSLPKEDSSTYRQSAAYVSKYNYNQSKPSADWYTTITYRVDYEDLDMYGSIHYSFHGSAQHNFPAYKVQLFMTDMYYPVNETIIAKANVEEEHVFSSLRPGKYEIKIEPYMSSDEHACKDTNGMVAACTVTTTKTIAIGDGTLLTFPSSTQTTTRKSPLSSTSSTDQSKTYKTMTSPLSSTSSTDQSKTYKTMTSPQTTVQSESPLQYVSVAPENQSDKVIAAVLGTVLGVMLITVFAYFVYCRRRHLQNDSQDNDRNNKSVPSCFGIQETDEKGPPPQDGNLVSRKFRKSSSKNLLLAYTVENNFHEDAVNKLGQYLQNRFQLTVTVKPCPVKSDLTAILSVLGYIDKADIFIFIWSPRSNALFNDDPRGERTNGVKQLFKCLENKEISAESHKERCLFAAFEYPTAVPLIQHDAFHTESFRLLTNLNKLLDHLLKCGVKTRKSVISYQKSSDTRALQKAISLAIQYHEESLSIPPDSGFQSLDRPSTQRLDSISNVLQQQQRMEQYHPDPALVTTDYSTDCYVLCHEEIPAMPFKFHPPSEIVDDINTVAIQNEIEMFNQRNMNTDNQLFFLHGEDPGYSYDNAECVSVGSGKSV